MLQARPKDGDHRFYCPDRDLAHVGLSLARQAMVAMEEGARSPSVNLFLRQQSVTEEALGKGVEALAKFFVLIADPEVQDAASAMELSGINGLPEPVRSTVLAYVGQTCISAIFESVRCVPPDSHKDLCVKDIVEAARRTQRVSALPGFIRRPVVRFRAWLRKRVRRWSGEGEQP